MGDSLRRTNIGRKVLAVLGEITIVEDFLLMFLGNRDPSLLQSQVSLKPLVKSFKLEKQRVFFCLLKIMC